MAEQKSVILIADDEPATRAALAALLESQGYELAFAADGPEALTRAAALTPDLILLDVMLPGMDGFEVCRRLRADPVLAEVPVIMVTVLDDRDSRLRGIEAGADDFVSKPYDRVELRARVRTVTRLNRYRRLVEINKELLQAYHATLEGWVNALDLRDKETEGHTQRVTDMTVCVARAMGMTDEELVHVRRGALLHDIGKIAIPDGILLKPGPLNEEEWAVMRQHPVYAYEMLSPIAFLRPALDIPYCHHEKWDGTGYPRGLKGEAIPKAARVFAASDVWDALRSDRPYRKGWPRERVREHIRGLSGTHLDPEVVDAFLRMDF